MKKWYQIKALGPRAEGKTTAELLVYGDIGETWWGESITAAQLVKDLQEIHADVLEVRINSFGGAVSDSLAIYNALRRYPGTVNVFIDGVAMSAAATIAMAGESVTMAANAILMIHAPWTWSAGNAQELRAEADVLDKFAHAMATCYDRSGEGVEAHLALLMDGQDHYFTAEEAVEAGYADAIGEAIEVAAHARPERMKKVPAAAAAFFKLNQSGASMPEKDKAAPNPAKDPIDQKETVADPIDKQEGGDPPKIRSAAQTADIRKRFAMFKDREGVQALLEDVLADPEITPAQASQKLLDVLGKDIEPANPAGSYPRIQTQVDEVDKRRGAEEQAILARAGVRAEGKPADLSANPFRGFRLMDHARAALARAGRRTDGMTQMEIVAAAITQGTTDFPVLLENVMHKALLGAYALQPSTWQRICATGSVSDFRPHKRYRTGSFGNLDVVNELAEFKAKAIPDGQSMSIQAITKGNLVSISRQAIVNDDMGAFVGLAASLGRAAKRSIDVDVFALLAENSGAGPTQADGQPFFHSANRGNVGTGGIPSVVSFDEMRNLMRMQKDISGNDYIDLVPAVLLVHTSNAGAAKVLNDAQYDPDTANKLQRPNMVRGMFGDIVDSPRVSGAKKYYAFADPAIAAAFEVAFLDGNQEPYLELQMGWTVDGAQYKVRLDYGVAEQDYRAATYNPGE